MKRKSYFVVLFIGLFTFSAANVWAQNVIKYVGRAMVQRAPLTVAERSILPTATGVVTHEINYNIGSLGTADLMKVRALSVNKGFEVYLGEEGNNAVLIPPQLADCTPYFHQLRESSQLTRESFPSLWQPNQELLRASLQNSMMRTAAINNQKLFYSSLHTEVFEDTLPYYRYLPAHAPDYIYVGEVHKNPLIQEELITLLGEIQRRYPARNIYLATEYAWESQERSTLQETLPLAMARNKQELRTLLGDDYVNFQFLHQAIKMGIPVVGLEPFIAMAQETRAQSAQQTPNRLRHNRVRLSTSEIGMQMRNRRWAAHIQQIRAQDSNALIVVHGGAKHTSFHELVSVSNMLQEESFSLMLFDWRARDISNPVLATLDDQQFLWRQFEQASEGKYVLSFKKPDPAAGRTPEKLDEFKHALGADMVVFLKDMSPMIDP